MQFHLLDWSGAARPRFSFTATGPGAFRAAIAGLQPHDNGPGMQVRRWDGRSIVRRPAVAGWHYTVCAEMAADGGRPWALFDPSHRPGYYVETMVGMAGARLAGSVWPEVVASVAELDDYLRGLNGLAAWAAEDHPPKPNLRLIDDDE